MPIHSGNMTNQNVTYQLGHAPPPLRNTRHDVFMINEQLQQFAYQAFQCHRPSLNGPMSPSYMPMSPVVWTAPLMATATPHSGYLPARATGYHMALGTPTTSSDPTTPFAYHANPNGSLVNTTQGTVHIDESRAVLIRNLNYRASLEDVRHFFSSAGRIEHCDIGASQKERKKCTARLRFVTAQEAKAAVAIFGSAKFMGRVITAEIAKDDSTIESGALGSNLASTELASIPPKARSGSGPLIIDGSNEIPTDEIKKTVEKIETMKLRK
ncbi:hypothetical protein MMC19_003226 [Ptychographa xylographoides]|nr:hypothetical protein [Ptychographa xylographoides]